MITARRMLADKLGWRELELAAEGGPPGDEALLAELFELLQQTEIDMTLFFRATLARVPVDAAADDATRIEPLTSCVLR